MPVAWGDAQDPLEELVDDRQLLVVGGFEEDRGVVLGGVAAVDQEGGVATVVDDEVGPLAVGPGQGLLGAPPVLLEALALPREDRDAGGGDGGGGVVLGREDVARRPADIGAEVDQGLDEDRGLDRHVERARDPRAGEGFGRAVLRAHRHETRHLLLGDDDLASTPVGQGDVGNLVIGRCRGHGWSFQGKRRGASERVNACRGGFYYNRRAADTGSGSKKVRK